MSTKRLFAATVLACVFTGPALAHATALPFGAGTTDLNLTPNVVFNDVRQVFQTTKTNASTAPVAAPQTGVIVKIRLKVNNNASGVKYRIMTLKSGATYTARTAFAANTASVNVTGGAINDY